MNKKIRTLLVSLGVSAIMLFSFASVAMAAGYGGGTTRIQECQLDGECTELCLDPIQSQQRLSSVDRLAGGKLQVRSLECAIVAVE